MDGKLGAYGLVAGVTTIKNPPRRAAVMDKSEHVMMVSRGAEQFAAKNGRTIVDPSYFYTGRPMERVCWCQCRRLKFL